MAENDSSNGVGVSYIEVDRERISAEEMLAVEQACNDAIREAVEVEVKTFEAGDLELNTVCCCSTTMSLCNGIMTSKLAAKKIQLRGFHCPDVAKAAYSYFVG